MRSPLCIQRRFLAVIGMIALAFAYLPGAVGILSAKPLPTCCAGALCPMHHMSGGHMDCGMDMSHPGTTCEACPCRTPQYTAAALVFNRVAPPPLSGQQLAGAAPVLYLIAPSSIESEVISPPPRTIPS
jgi:hypothetical protein